MIINQPFAAIDRIGNFDINAMLGDSKVTYMEGFHYWVEVKGYMDSKSQTKIKRFQKYFPNETLFVIDKKWFKKNSNIMYGIIKDWEKKEPKWTNIQEKLKLE